MSFEYALIDESDYKTINKNVCKKIFDKANEDDKKLLFFIVNKFDQKILIENSNIESLNNYKTYLKDVNNKEKKEINKKASVSEKFTKEIYEIGCGDFEKNFKISNSITRDLDGNQEKFKPEKLDSKLEDYEKSVKKIIKSNKNKIEEHIKLELLYNINQITKNSSFAFNQYFEKKLDNELRKLGIVLDFKKDFYNENEEECSFCNKKSKNILYDYFDNNYKLCKNCESALSSFYPHNFVTKKNK